MTHSKDRITPVEANRLWAVREKQTPVDKANDVVRVPYSEVSQTLRGTDLNKLPMIKAVTGPRENSFAHLSSKVLVAAAAHISEDTHLQPYELARVVADRLGGAQKAIKFCTSHIAEGTDSHVPIICSVNSINIALGDHWESRLSLRGILYEPAPGPDGQPQVHLAIRQTYDFIKEALGSLAAKQAGQAASSTISQPTL